MDWGKYFLYICSQIGRMKSKKWLKPKIVGGKL